MPEEGGRRCLPPGITRRTGSDLPRPEEGPDQGGPLKRKTLPGKVRIASRSEVAPGTGKVVEAGGRLLALFNVAGSFYAVHNLCPHRGGPLGEGHLEEDRVTCPLHGWQFDVCTGLSPRSPGLSVPCVPLEIQEDEIFALLE